MNFDLAELTRRVGAYRKPTLVAAPIQPTKAHRESLQRIYMQIVRGWQKLFRENILPAYTRTLSETITDTVEDVQAATGDAEREMARLVVFLNASFEGWEVVIEEWHRSRFVSSYSATGVNFGTLLGRNDVQQTLEAVLTENVSLIRSLNDQMRNGITGAVFRGLQSRTNARDLAREIRAIAGVGARRAELIASDQLTKITGRLDRERQQQAGLVKFEWAHSGKVNFRPEHKARDGKVFDWNDRRLRGDLPGVAIRCGCRSRGILEIEQV